MTTQEPDYGSMTIPDMVRAYNAMVATGTELGLTGYRPRKGFHDRTDGLARLEMLASSVKAARQGARDEELRPKREQKVAEVVATPGETGESAGAQTMQTHEHAGKARAKREPRGAAGKPPKTVDEMGTCRAGTARAEVLKLMGSGNLTFAEISEKVGANAAAHAYCNWRDLGVGYEVGDSGKVIALYPRNRGYADVVKNVAS